jgi:hypothetical protein
LAAMARRRKGQIRNFMPNLCTDLAVIALR